MCFPDDEIKNKLVSVKRNVFREIERNLLVFYFLKGEKKIYLNEKTLV